MKCLSIYQPWAHLIAMGEKAIENRTWRTPYRGPLLIHASKCRADPGLLMQFCRLLPPIIAYGAIIGRAELVDCLDYSKVAGQRYAEGPVCWLLRNAAMFQRPIPYTGQRMLFEVPDSLLS